jgi:hypothetical protein
MRFLVEGEEFVFSSRAARETNLMLLCICHWITSAWSYGSNISNDAQARTARALPRSSSSSES